MPDNSNFLNNPLAATIFLLAAHTPDPVGKIKSLNLTINSLQEAIKQINAGLAMFNSEVMPILTQPTPGKNDFTTREEKG